MSSGVHITHDFKEEVACGALDGYHSIWRSGSNASVPADSTADVCPGGAFNFLSTASAVRVKVGGNIDDDALGDGARSIRLLGLDENFALTQEEIPTAGVNASPATTTTFIRILLAFVSGAGVYGGNNAGDVDIEAVGGDTLARIAAGKGHTQMATFTVPVGYAGSLKRILAVVDSNKAADVDLWLRKDIDVVTAPFSAKQLVQSFPQLMGSASDTFESVILIPEKTDLWFTSTTSLGSPASVSAKMDLTITDKKFIAT